MVLATGYRERPLGQILAGLDPYLRRDSAERPRIDDQFRLALDPAVTGRVYVQNAELHTHGVGAPDLGLAAWRSATILNSLTGKDPYPLPRRTAFTTFGLEPQSQVPPARHTAQTLTPCRRRTVSRRPRTRVRGPENGSQPQQAGQKTGGPYNRRARKQAAQTTGGPDSRRA